MGSNSRLSPESPQALADLAARQHGNVTRAQLSALGFTDNAVAQRVATGHLHRVHRGVYAVGRPPAVPLERAAAAVLACGPTALLSHGSALTLWGVWKRWDVPLHVTVTRGDPRPPGIIVHRSRSLARPDLRRQLGIRVTSPARTLLDCAPTLSARGLTRAVDDARLARLVTPAQLAELVARNPTRPGVRSLRPLLDAPGNPTRSSLEDDFLAFCASHDLPRPALNTTVRITHERLHARPEAEATRLRRIIGARSAR